MDTAKTILGLVLEIRTTASNMKFNCERCKQVAMICNDIESDIKKSGIPSSDESVSSLVVTLEDCREFLLKISTSGLLMRLIKATDVKDKCAFYIDALERWQKKVATKVPLATPEQVAAVAPIAAAQVKREDTAFTLATLAAEDNRKMARMIMSKPDLPASTLAKVTIKRSDLQIGAEVDVFTLGIVYEGYYGGSSVYIRMIAENVSERVIELAEMGVVLNRKLKDCTNILPIHGICDKRLVVTKATSHGPLNKFRYKIATLDKITIARKIADAISYIHNCDVLHKDLRASSILLDDKLEPMVTGFELSRDIRDPTGGHEVEEHVRKWWSPEREKGSSRESDVYSFGVLMYEISMGKEPETRDANILLKEEKDNIHRDYSLLMEHCLGSWRTRPTMEQATFRLLSIESRVFRGDEIEP